MSASLKTIEATIDPDGTIHLAEPIVGPARAVITVLIEDPFPNATTIDAMREPLESLPFFPSVEALLEELNS
jgi:hypothetical protein